MGVVGCEEDVKRNDKTDDPGDKRNRGRFANYCTDYNLTTGPGLCQIKCSCVPMVGTGQTVVGTVLDLSMSLLSCISFWVEEDIGEERLTMMVLA